MNPTALREAPDRERASPPAQAARPEPPPAAAAPPAWVALSQRWPAIFNIDAPRPLKIGIHEDLLQAGLAPQDFKRALAHYCHTRRYRRTLVEGATRIDLDGRPAGVVTREHAIADLAPDAGRPRGGRAVPRARRAPPQPMTLSEAQCVKGRLELTLKFSELPKAIPGERDFTFGVDCEGTLIQVSVRPRLWNRLLQAAREYPQWVATVTGKMGPPTARGFVLLEPGLQVFEKKAKTEAAEPAAARPIPPAAAERVEAPPDWPRRPTLTLPGRGARGAAEADPASGGRRD